MTHKFNAGPVLLAFLGACLCLAQVSDNPLILNPRSVSATQTLKDEPAQSVIRFIDSIGINTHLTYTDTSYGNTGFVITEILRLGVKHVRDGYAAYNIAALSTLGKRGVRFGLNVGSPPYSALAFQKALSATTIGDTRYIEAWEGQNEPDINDRNWRNDWNTNVAALKAADAQGTPLWGPPLAFAGNAARLRPVQVAYGTFHPYPGGQNPSILFPSQLNLIAPLYPGAPMIASETGFHNALDDHSDQPAIDFETGAKYIPRLILESFRAGVYRTYIYELLDEESSWNAPLQDKGNTKNQCHWGLINRDGVEKPAFTALRNLIGILSKGANEVQASRLAYSLVGGKHIRHVLLQKSQSVYDLIVWQDVSSWNISTQQDIVNPPESVTLKVSARSVIKYQPSLSRNGKPLTSIGEFALEVPDEPVVLEITIR